MNQAPCPLISVIIPTYNMEEYIAETLISVQNQTFGSWEAIVVDDCSTDSTPEIVNQFAKQDSRIRYFRLPINSNLPAVPRNYGVSHARGKYLALLDHDDLWSPRKLERQAQILEADQAIAMVHSHLWVVRDGHMSWGLLYLPAPRESIATKSKLEERNMIQCSSVMIRMDVFQNLGGFDESLKLRAVEDYQLWFRVSKNHRIVFLSEVHGIYRHHKSGTSANEDMKHRLLMVDQEVGTRSVASQHSRTRKAINKVFNLPNAFFHLVIEGRLRQHFNIPPRFW